VLWESLKVPNTRRLLVLAGLALLLALPVGLLTASPAAQAMETRSGDRVVIGSNEDINDDLYVSANEIVVDGTVRGDLIAIGNSVRVNGAVGQDVMAAGRSVEIGGTVGHAARIAGQTLLLSRGARVDGDLLAAGYSLQNQPGSTVGGTLAYAGYQGLVEGTVDGDLKGFLNALELGGEIGKNVDVQVDGEGRGVPPFVSTTPSEVPVPTVQPGLALRDSARVGGDLNYESSAEAQISPDAQIGGQVNRTAHPTTQREEEATSPVANVLLSILRSFLALLLVGLLLVWLVPRWIRRLGATVLDQPLASLGWGVLAFIGFLALAIAILLATILLTVIFGVLTLGGLVLLFIGLGLLAEVALVVIFLISTNYLAQIIVSFLVGVLVLQGVRPGRDTGRVLPLVVGLILYVVLRAVPVLGVVVGLVVVLLGLGALSHWVWTKLRHRRAQSPNRL
jgi:cytoskeletal protein CcmA (bactofilin family)